MMGKMGVVAAVIVSLAAPSGLASADSLPGFGIVGLGRHQTARLNVTDVRTDAADPRALPCRLGLSFVDAGGATLSRTEVDVAPGRAVAFEYAAEPRSVPKRDSAPIRPTLVKLGAGCEDARLVTTLELVDRDGATAVL